MKNRELPPLRDLTICHLQGREPRNVQLRLLTPPGDFSDNESIRSTARIGNKALMTESREEPRGSCFLLGGYVTGATENLMVERRQHTDQQYREESACLERR